MRIKKYRCNLCFSHELDTPDVIGFENEPEAPIKHTDAENTDTHLCVPCAETIARVLHAHRGIQECLRSAKAKLEESRIGAKK